MGFVLEGHCLSAHPTSSKAKIKNYAGIPDEMNEYVHPKRPKSIMAQIHHAIVALQINFQGEKKPSQGKDTREQKGKGAQAQNAFKVLPTKKKKTQEKGYKGKARLSLE